MLSRIADSLYWMSRYMERADSMLRMIRTNYIISFDNIETGFPALQPSLEVFTKLEGEKLEILQNDTPASLLYLLTDSGNINSLKVILTRARENARGAQDHITREVWERMNGLYHLINNPDMNALLMGQEALNTLDKLSTARELYSGVIDSTMPRGQGWNFMNAGKYVERSILTLECSNFFFKHIEFDLKNEQDILYWRSLLLALSGYELYLKANRTSQHNANVTEQILFNGNFPRSLYYSLARIGRYLESITNANPVEGSSHLLRSFNRLKSSVQFAELAIIEREGLADFLKSLHLQLNGFAQLIGNTYFSYS